MARPTGDPFIDAVYDGIPTQPVNEVHRYVPDMNVAYGVPFEPETWPEAQRSCAPCMPGLVRSVQRDGSVACLTPYEPIGLRCPTIYADRLGQTPEDEGRNVRNSLIALGIVAALVIPAAAWVLWSERRGAR